MSADLVTSWLGHAVHPNLAKRLEAIFMDSGLPTHIPWGPDHVLTREGNTIRTLGKTSTTCTYSSTKAADEAYATLERDGKPIHWLLRLSRSGEVKADREGRFGDEAPTIGKILDPIVPSHDSYKDSELHVSFSEYGSIVLWLKDDYVAWLKGRLEACNAS